MTYPLMVFVVCCSVLLFVGVALVCWGWIGDRRSGTPSCQKCKFDLSGTIPERAECPECGQDLSAKRAFRNSRTIRKAPLLIGGIICLFFIVVGSLVVVSQIVGVDLNSYKPSSWLIYEASVENEDISTTAFGELAERFDHGNLTKSQIQECAGIVLNRIQNGWEGSWEGGFLFESSIEGGWVEASILLPLAKQRFSIRWVIEEMKEFDYQLLHLKVLDIDDSAQSESILIDCEVEVKGASLAPFENMKFKISTDPDWRQFFEIEFPKKDQRPKQLTVIMRYRATHIPTGKPIGKWSTQEFVNID